MPSACKMPNTFSAKDFKSKTLVYIWLYMGVLLLAIAILQKEAGSSSTCQTIFYMQFITYPKRFITQLHKIVMFYIIMQSTRKAAASNNIYTCAVNWPKTVHTNEVAEENMMGF